VFETFFQPAPRDVFLHLGAALLAGGAIGVERSFHGRPAGFRTHALVCVASSMLMLITLYQASWFPASSDESVRIDPTRMAQGIMTGIGFLGAGVIFKEGITVRGLTTAASIWITSAIGVLMGSGLYFPAVVGTVITIGVLSAFRLIERHLPSHKYARQHLSFAKGEVMPEGQVVELLGRHGFHVTSISYRVSDEGRRFEYDLVIRTADGNNFSRLATALGSIAVVREFHLSPAGE
jgi:putative Mg2+ transporter-C (MgtC) family protein